jgi:hypothetical protein
MRGHILKEKKYGCGWDGFTVWSTYMGGSTTKATATDVVSLVGMHIDVSV